MSTGWIGTTISVSARPPNPSTIHDSTESQKTQLTLSVYTRLPCSSNVYIKYIFIRLFVFFYQNWNAANNNLLMNATSSDTRAMYAILFRHMIAMATKHCEVVGLSGCLCKLASYAIDINAIYWMDCGQSEKKISRTEYALMLL